MLCKIKAWLCRNFKKIKDQKFESNQKISRDKSSPKKDSASY